MNDTLGEPSDSHHPTVLPLRRGPQAHPSVATPSENVVIHRLGLRCKVFLVLLKTGRASKPMSRSHQQGFLQGRFKVSFLQRIRVFPDDGVETAKASPVAVVVREREHGFEPGVGDQAPKSFQSIRLFDVTRRPTPSSREGGRCSCSLGTRPYFRPRFGISGSTGMSTSVRSNGTGCVCDPRSRTGGV